MTYALCSPVSPPLSSALLHPFSLLPPSLLLSFFLLCGVDPYYTMIWWPSRLEIVVVIIIMVITAMWGGFAVLLLLYEFAGRLGGRRFRVMLVNGIFHSN
ncbi:hypothetical protein JB92DRAFT_2853577 [Gautieria morchelliformis]|nr:hypothetical protein JB92DRAFT_2853577 [Gautieria morchelliformis]